jgi:hypothetical protein
MPDKQFDFIQQLLLAGSMVLAWLAGETGRIMVAGGAGGALRWLSSERRNMRDGVIAIIGGSIIAYYFWPLVLNLLTKYIGIDPTTSGAEAMSGCLAGIFGVSGIRIGVAIVEAYAGRIARGKDG